MIQTLLIANRGEIAVRVIRAARELGIRTVAVYAPDDARAAFVEMADEARALAGDSPATTYLDGAAICAAARAAGADAIHPGYGFLAESAAFARAVAAVGLTFVGPSPETMDAVGAKVAAKSLAASAGVPTIPWADGAGMTGAALAKAAGAVGFPLLVKASAGGGGKGMRLVECEADLAEAASLAAAEASAAFGDGRLFLERRIDSPRHVEIQVLGDASGRVVAFPERECSIQRRHQKLVEESPSPAVDAGLRVRLEEAAVAIASAARYSGAGTIEFLVEPSGAYFFLEVNARLQVEHPVTEAVTGLDLVAWQLRIAGGETLPADLAGVAPRGHAIECRVTAEDASRGFLPAAGRVERFVAPAGPGIRVDSGIRTGDAISPRYDSLVAKVIAHGEDRSASIRRMAHALRETVLLGLPSNLNFLFAVIDHPAFRRGETTTGFVEDHGAALLPSGPAGDRELAAIALFETLLGPPAARGSSAGARTSPAGEPRERFDPWERATDFRCGR